ncbi:PP2C family protein-serine/threonine phosphatase [Crocinitomix catalasitica]|nr:PP2C family protein-serine/threonine phosphatase [Crocinitomix catalasitica]
MSFVSEKAIEVLEERVRSKEFKLNSLLEVTKAINANKSVDELLELYNFILGEQLGLRKFVLFHKQNGWQILAKVGIKGKLKDIDIDEDLNKFTDITVIESSYKKTLNKFDVIVPVFHEESPLAYLILAGLKKMDNANGNPYLQLNFIQTLTNIIVVAIENKRLAKDSIRQERVKQELEVASEMQRMLFPSELPTNHKIDISAKYLSHSKVSGDYYDYIQLNENEFIVCIADVSGKGISAAMLMANFQATVRTLYHYKRQNLTELVRQLNENVFQAVKGEKFVTFFVAEYNSKTRILQYVNAGHNYPILMNGSEIKYLNKGCIGLGMLTELPFLEYARVEVQPNTTLVLYTDGVVELENDTSEQFETERLTDIMKNFSALSMEDLNGIIFGKLDEWRGVRKYVDDTAILSCRIF